MIMLPIFEERIASFDRHGEDAADFITLAETMIALAPEDANVGCLVRFLDALDAALTTYSQALAIAQFNRAVKDAEDEENEKKQTSSTTSKQ